MTGWTGRDKLGDLALHPDVLEVLLGHLVVERQPLVGLLGCGLLQGYRRAGVIGGAELRFAEQQKAKIGRWRERSCNGEQHIRPVAAH